MSDLKKDYEILSEIIIIFLRSISSNFLRYNNLTGDVLISSGIIAYLGCFLAKYRNESVDSWISLMQDLS